MSLSILVLSLACSDPDTDTAAGADELMLQDLEAALEGYESWDHAPEWPGVEASATSHDAFTEVFFNEVSFATYEAQVGGEMPVGAVIAKQSWKDAEATEEANFTAMMKVEGTGWFWASWDPSGEPVLTGQPALCTGCHAGGQDGVMVVSW